MLSITLLLAVAPLSPQTAPWVIGIEQLHRLDLLPTFHRTLKIGAVTSYDRSGGNDDGFSGKYSFVRKEGEHLVLADLQGPGCIYRIHTPTPTDDPLEFYFDGESTPRLSIPFREMFTGKRAPFLRPMVDYAGGGYYSYIPMPYKKTCKVILRGKHLQFYDLNYATFPSDAPVTTFDPKAVAADQQGLDKAKRAFSGGRERDLAEFNVPPGTKLRKQGFDVTLAPGKEVTVFQSNRPGRLASLRLAPAESLTSKSRDVLLRISWDNEKAPAVLCPAGDFFGYAWGKPAMGSALVGTHKGVNYCNLPMPFDRAAKIELVNLGREPVPVKGEVVVGDKGRRSDEGKFYAVWRRENPATGGKPFTWLNTTGRGHIVGLAVHAQGRDSGSTEFFEGDDQTTVDGELVVHGTGSEDFFNGGWYDVPGRWDRTMARPLSGCMLYQKHLGRTGGYRFFLGDAYSYRKSILQTIEHGPVNNAYPADYCGIVYFYSEKPPTADFGVPSLAERTVIDPTRIVQPAHWTVPISSFSFREATLSRKDVPSGGTGKTRCLSMRTKGDDFFGPPFISLTCDLPAEGRYEVYIDAVKGPEQGRVQLFQDEFPIGEAVDLYAAEPILANGVRLGTFNAVEGANDVMFKIVGKNPAATNHGFDLVNIVFVRMP